MCAWETPSAERGWTAMPLAGKESLRPATDGEGKSVANGHEDAIPWRELMLGLVAIAGKELLRSWLRGMRADVRGGKLFGVRGDRTDPEDVLGTGHRHTVMSAKEVG